MKRIVTGLLVLFMIMGAITSLLTVSASASAEVTVPAAEAETTMTFGERLQEAGMVTLQGMFMVFAVLALLWGVIELFRVAMTRSAQKDVESKQANTPATQVSESIAPVPQTMVQTTEVTEQGAVQEIGTDSEELVAAITAAVAAYLASEQGTAYTGGFRVVSFKRTGTGSAWNKNN